MLMPCRTTLDIDDDVLQAAKDLAANRRTTAGKVLSDLARQALEPRRQVVVQERSALSCPVGPGREPEDRRSSLVNRLRDEP